MRTIFLSILLIILTTSVAHGQRFIGSVIGGMNVSQVDGDEVYGFKKVGANAGLSVMLPLDKKQRFFVTVELLYSQKGARAPLKNTNADYRAFDDTMIFDTSIPVDSALLKSMFYKLNLDYVEVPVLFHFEDPRSKCAIGVGVAWARLVRVKEIEFGRQLTTNLQSDRYKKNEWSIIADVKVPIYKGLKLNFRYQYSLSAIGEERKFYSRTATVSDNYVVRKPYNNMFSVRLIYSFNERWVENNKTNSRGEREGPKWVRDTHWQTR